MEWLLGASLIRASRVETGWPKIANKLSFVHSRASKRTSTSHQASLEESGSRKAAILPRRDSTNKSPKRSRSLDSGIWIIDLRSRSNREQPRCKRSSESRSISIRSPRTRSIRSYDFLRKQLEVTRDPSQIEEAGNRATSRSLNRLVQEIAWDPGGSRAPCTAGKARKCRPSISARDRAMGRIR